MGSKLGPCLVLALSVALPASARASEGAAYSAPESCPSEAELRASIGARLPERALIPEFRLAITTDGREFTGALEMDGEFRRALVALSCADVIDGAALVISARAAERDAEARRAQEEAASSPHPAPRSPSPRPEVEEARPSPPRVASRVAVPRDLARLSFSFFAGGGVWGGVAPKPMWGPEIGVGLRAAQQPAWSVRLGVDRAASGTIDAPPAAIWTRLSTASIAGCAFLLGSVPRLEACILGRAGVFEAGGIARAPIVRAEEITAAWISFGPSLRAEVRIAPQLRLAWELVATVPLARERLVFRQPDVLVHETSTVVAGLRVSLEWVSVAWPMRSKGEPRGMAR